MKILFINLPFAGHVYPTLGLVKELVDRNNEVSYLLTKEWKERITDIGAEFIEYKNHKKLSFQMVNACQAALNIADAFDLIIYEQFFFLGKHIADKFHKPVIRIFTSLATNHILMDGFTGYSNFKIFRSKWICSNWTKSIAKDLPLKTNCWLKEIIENPPDINLIYTTRSFQPYIKDFPSENYKFIGSSIYLRSCEKEFEFPNIKGSLIYISLGTIINKKKSFYRKCFSAFKDENVTVILSVGNTIKSSDLGTIPDNFHIYPFVPQLRVLEKTKVFITHGGLNSITESLYFSVPMIVIPFITDQPTNARQIERLKLGKTILPKQVTSETLNRGTLEILNSKAIRENALLMQKEIKSSGGNKAGADLVIEYMNRVKNTTSNKGNSL
jgi:MGT family glycosyltransferase